MSKRKSHKKNQDMEDENHEKLNVRHDNHELTSKSKVKGKKKGKGKADDWSDSDNDIQKKVPESDDDDMPTLAMKKSQKKGTYILEY